MNSKLHVLIPDGNSTWALSVLNCLSQSSEYEFFVLSDKKRTATRFSKYTSYYKYYKRTTDNDWLNIISKEIVDQTISIIVPIAEDEIRFFITNSDRLPKSVKVIPLPKINDFETAINKHMLSRFLDEAHLPHPKYSYFKSFESYSNELLELQFPVLLKPLHEKGGDGILKFKNQEKLDSYIHKHSDFSDLFIQEFIDGYDIDCSVLCLNGKVLTHTIQKGNLEGHSSFAPQLGFEFLKNDVLLSVIKQLMQALNWSGVAHIDLRYDVKTKDYKIIEINARFWGSVEGSKFAGINFPDLAIQLAMNNEIENTQFNEIEYMRFKGVLKSIKRKPSFLFKKNYLLNNSETKSFLKDPLPTCYRFIEWLERRFNFILLFLSQEFAFYTIY
ncbi:ATP-grasp domain-containing protein [Psychroserpens ponticola]|uniref:ATP-grasp domain-containing protein n=1 Tax=Psychroserpens ponticola TaxID=2932268 RepID=A0ABY7RZH8_9FLAO|nr:ATP-grasp domain-containing protein [Psychroserpens ponticola]WCO02487.1 ATP-grasp domain-containing protein [Psychroserpens ponticola]